MKQFIYHKFFFLGLIILGLLGCGGGGSVTTGPGPGPDPNPKPADHWVLSGNVNGTISILRVDPMAGFANTVAFHDMGSGFTILDMVYDAANGRILALTSNEFRTLKFDAASGQIVNISSYPTSGRSSHFVLNSAGTSAYVASGANNNQLVDIFTITSNGGLSAPTSVSLTIDPDYIMLNPAGSRLYVVSRTDSQIAKFDVNGDGSLAANPTTINTDQNPTALVFHTTGAVAYLIRSDDSQDSLQMLNVDANGDLAPAAGAFFDVDTNPIDMILSANGDHLYVLERSNREVHHFSVDTTSGALTFVNSLYLSFPPTDLTLSSTGAELYISHLGNLVSTLSVNTSDGTLTLMGFARVFDGASSIAAVGGAGTLTPTATFLLVPDETGLSKFSIGMDGLLTLVDKENAPNALISGEVAVQYAAGLLFGTGQDASNRDLLTSYTFNPVTGDLAFVQLFDATVVDPNRDSRFERIELGRSGRFMYILDKDIIQSSPARRGRIRAYAYASDGTVTTTAFDTEVVGMAPENMIMHPAGRYIYSINSFGDNISIFEVNKTNGILSARSTVTPGGVGAGNGRPIDMKFHPNGRFAFVSLEDDSELVTYTVDPNGTLNDPSRQTPPLNNGVPARPGSIAVHPNGKYVYVGEIYSGGAINPENHIALYDIDQTDFSLMYRTRISTGTTPPIPFWIEVDPSGQYLYARVRASGATGEVRVFNIDQATGTLTDANQSIEVGYQGGSLPTMTLVIPLL